MIPCPFRLLVGIAVLTMGTAASALEYPIGKPQIRSGMEISAVYLQPVTMEPAGMMRDAKASDIHLEADIKAIDKNDNGFADGTWVPYLAIAYEVTKQGSGDKISGTM